MPRPPEVSFVGQLISQIYGEVELLRSWGADSAASAARHTAELLETAWKDWLEQELTIDQAAAETGLQPETVRKKIARGEWPNAGQKYRPRVKRRETLRASVGSRHQGGGSSRDAMDLIDDVLTAYEDTICD